MKENWFTFDREKQTITIQFSDKKDLVIDKNNVDISYFSGGPGGQNVNRNLKGVQLIFRIPSDYLLLSKKTKQLITRVFEKHSLHHNTQTAYEQLAFKVRSYFYIPPFRKKTKIPKNKKNKNKKFFVKIQNQTNQKRTSKTKQV